jgi:hypothetical protein
VLLVEGVDDEHVIRNLLFHHGITTAKIVQKTGCDTLLRDLPVELKRSDLKQLGIILDADEEPLIRWNHIKHILTTAGYTVPDLPGPNGVIVRDRNKPDVGVWLMPDNTVPGMLENFIATLVPQSDVLWTYVLDAVSGLPIEHCQFRKADLPKVHIHTWLAWQREPGRPMGGAIVRKYLDPDAATALAFVAWTKALLDVP